MTVYPPVEQWFLETIPITTTAGNVAFDISPGAGWRFKIQYGVVEYVADGNAANRNITATPRTAAGVQLGPSLQVVTSITAGQTRLVGFSGIDFGDLADGKGFTVWNDVGYIPIPYMLEGTDILRITASNGVAGDSYSGSLTVLKLKL